MKLKDALYTTPEMTEEKLLELIKTYSPMFRNVFKDRLAQLHKTVSIEQAILDEYDLIQDKKSKLTKSQREQVSGFVSFCLIQMAKGNGGESTSTDRLESISEAEEVRDNSN